QQGTIFDSQGNSYNATTAPYTATDSNGNTITVSGSGNSTDTLGRSIPNPESGPVTSTAPCPSLGAAFQSVASATSWTPPGAGTFTLCWTNININTNFFNGLTPPTYNEARVTRQMLQSLVLPNGTAWNFIYDSADPNNAQSFAYGDLTKIIFPTGGSISYTWDTSTPCDNGSTGWPAESRAVTSRTLDANDGTGTKRWDYSGGPSSFNSSTGETTIPTVVTAPLVTGETQRNDTLHYITGLA